MSLQRKLRIVPRAPGDDTPLAPGVAEALRKAGIDPTKFTVLSGEGDPFADIPAPGARLAHTFRFARLNDAFDAMQRLLDDATAARISKDGEAWVVVFESREDAKVDDAAEHARVAALALPFGGEDRGFSRVNVSVNVRRVGK